MLKYNTFKQIIFKHITFKHMMLGSEFNNPVETIHFLKSKEAEL